MVRIPLLAIAIAAVVTAHEARAQTQTQSTPPPLVIHSMETRWTDVMCDLTEVSRPNPGELMVRVRYRNVGKRPMKFPDLKNVMELTEAIEPIGRIVYGALKDASGALVGSTTIGDTVKSGRSIAPGGSQAHWVKLIAPPDDIKIISINAPGAVVFDDVPIGAKPSMQPRATVRPAIASQEGSAEGITVEVVDARRTASGVATIVWRYRHGGSQRFRFTDLSNEAEKAYALHPGSSTKFPVIQTKDRDSLSGTTLALGSTMGQRLEPGETLTVWAKFQAPPESAKTISFVVPGSAPFENLPLAGAFTGSEVRLVAVNRR